MAQREATHSLPTETHKQNLSSLRESESVRAPTGAEAFFLFSSTLAGLAPRPSGDCTTQGTHSDADVHARVYLTGLYVYPSRHTFIDLLLLKSCGGQAKQACALRTTRCAASRVRACGAATQNWVRRLITLVYH